MLTVLFIVKVKDQVKMDYHQRVMLLAYYKQEKYGMYSPEKDTNTGYFDLVGSDRRYAYMIEMNIVSPVVQGFILIWPSILYFIACY